jgi:thiol-disulfide isomerase/thioredoxin
MSSFGSKILLIAAFGFLFTGLFAGCQSKSAPKIISPAGKLPQTRVPMPPLSSSGKNLKLEELGWQMEDGIKQKLADHKGKVLVLDFWATYCPPCIEEIPHLTELHDKHAADGLTVIGLNVGGDEDKPEIPAFVKKLSIKYALGYPEDDLTTFLFAGRDAIPQTFVFGRDGKLAANFTGYDPQIKDELDKAVGRELAK